jgi:Secretion system C-terminal sorting domain
MKFLHLLIWIILIGYGNRSQAIVKGNFSLTITSGNYFYADHNDCASGGGPRASFLATRVQNVSGITQNNIVVEFVKYTNNTLYSLAGGQITAQQIVSMANNGQDTMYWYSTYPCTAGNATNVIFQVRDLDDNSSYFDTLTGLSVENQISSNGGGLVGTSSVTKQESVGGLFCFKSNYNFPKLVNGDVAYMQPTTNLSFDAASYQLESAVVLTSTANSTSCIPVGNSPFNYNITANCGNSFDISIEYCFRIVNSVSTQAYPYNSATSGEVGLKYVITNVPVNIAPSSTLPVELVFFSAQSKATENVLSWQTLSEENSAFFDIQRSDDGIRFYSLYTVEAAHYSHTPRDYMYIDQEPLPVSYYRLRMVDQDGTEEYSSIIVARAPGSAPGVSVKLFPNPSPDFIQLNMEHRAENSRIQVFSLSGALVKEIFLSSIDQTYTLPVNDIASGFYRLYYTDDSGSITKSFIKI